MLNRFAGRFQVVDDPVLYPNKCGVCGHTNAGVDDPTNRRQFIDWGLEWDDIPVELLLLLNYDPRYIQHLYVCFNCAEELISVVNVRQLDEAHLEILRLSNLVEDLSEKVQEYELTIGVINSAIGPNADILQRINSLSHPQERSIEAGDGEDGDAAEQGTPEVLEAGEVLESVTTETVDSLTLEGPILPDGFESKFGPEREFGI